jgi:microcystin-dependent protein
MKKIIVLLAFLFPALAQAQIVPTPLPVTLTNGTLADANQVMSDFNAIVTGVNTNGAKNGANSDITSLSALTTPITPAQGGSNVYVGTGSGTANAQLVVTPVPTGYALTSGYTTNFIPSATNTSATTLSVAGTTAKAVLRQTSAGLQPLVGGEIVVNQMATVIYDGTQYELINNAAGAIVPVGTIIDTASATGAPVGYLLTDGSLVSRTTYAGLFSVISATGVAATLNSTTSVAVANSALYSVGWFVGGTNVTCNSTITSIPDGTHIVISNAAGATGATTLTIGPYSQGDCSTTFGVPQLNGRATVMRDSVGSTLTATTCTDPASVGTNCGAQTTTIAQANLPNVAFTVSGITLTNGNPTVHVDGSATFIGGGTSIAGSGRNSSTDATQPSVVTAVSVATQGSAASGGSGTALTNIQPIALVTKAIKF